MKLKLLLHLFCYFLIFCKGFSVFASTEQPTSFSSSDGARVGVGIAGEYANVEANLKIRSPTRLGNISSSQQQTCKKLQLSPSLELGTPILNNYYLGFIVSWHYSNANTTSTSPIRGAYHFSHQFKLKSYIDAFLKPGYRLTSRMMIYGVIGPSIANWSHTTEQFSVNGSTQVTRLIDTFKIRGQTVGLGFGCGFEYLIQDKYALSFECTSHIHRSKTASQTLSYKDGRDRSGDLVKIVQPSYSTFAVRLTYFFSLF
jgi:hypothetical protein